MEPKTSADKRTEEIIDLIIRIGLIAFLAWLAMKVFSPFLGLMIWAIVLATALFPLNRKLANKLGGSNGRAATVMVLGMLLLLGVPTVLLSISLVNESLDTYAELSSGTLTVPYPKESVQQWPLIGPKLYSGWEAAATNTKAFLIDHEEQVVELSRKALGLVTNSLATLLAFIGAFIIAGIMMAYAHPGTHSIRRIFVRICGPKSGPELHVLSVATVRSVAVGVIGVAFIQAVLLGVGFLFADVPAAGILALLALLLGVAQIPAALIVIPVIIWIWTSGDGSTVSNVIFSVYLIVASLADNVLKPMMLGRGLAIPMPVILLGALGGMITSGIIGLFIGAVILAVAYQVFMAWVNEGLPAGEANSPPSDHE